MFDSLFGLLGLIGIVALIAVALRQNSRIRVLEQEIGVRQESRVRLLEREMGALRSFVLSAPTGPASAAHASADAETSSANEGRLAAALKQDSQGVSGEDVLARGAGASESEPVALSDATSGDVTSADTTSAADLAPELAATRDAGDGALAGTGPQDAAGSVAAGVVPAAKKGPDIETALGTRWAVWVGGVALALGGIFLVRYTIEAGWFGPGARLTLAGLFGLILVAAGEYIRRTGFRVPLEGIANAYIPAILTAAGAFSLFGTVYAAHAIYDFIGAGPAFVLLGIIGVATMALALIHGQALAGIGLLGSLVTPVLVSSDSPKPWILFGYLAIVLTATIGISRIRRWRFLASAGFLGVGLWTLIYIVAGPIDVDVVAFISGVSLACLGLVWCNGTGEEGDAAIFPSIMPAVFVGLVSAGLMADPAMQSLGGIWPGAALLIAMVAIAVWRAEALALLYGAGVFAALVFLQSGLAGVFEFEVAGQAVIVDGFPVDASAGPLFYPGILLALVFFAVGVWQARRLVATAQAIAASWAAFAVLVPLIVVCAFWLALGDPNIDLRYATAALVLSIALAAGGEAVARAEQPPLIGAIAVSIMLAGAGAALIAAIHMAFGPGLTTILCGAAAVLPALATRYRSYSVLGWMCVAAVIIVLARVAFDPTIVGAADLGRTPVLNALLAGYGIPALAFTFCAWQLARTTGGRPHLAMEASAIFFALLTAAMLVRHAMHGGVIDSSEPTLAEQAIYSVIGLAAGAILVSLDLRSPSSVLRYASLAVGVLSVAAIALQHFMALNPLFTNELTGRIPVFNLLFLAYLLPAIAAGALALYARGRRPKWYSAMLALTASLLAFAYATLSVRRLFWGEYIGAWHGLEPLETYSYSALWLAMGVVLLVIGVRTGSFVIRAASAVVIAATVAKVFLFDMSELQGFLRALSFIGLGAVLIGIGLFYQRLLTRSASDTLIAKVPEPKEESGG